MLRLVSTLIALPTLVALTLVALMVAARPSPAAAQAAPVAPTAAAPIAAFDSAAAIAFGHRLTDWFFTAEADSLWAHTGEEMRGFMGSAENLSDQIYGFVRQFGFEEGYLRESLARQGDAYVYTRVVRLDASESPWTMAWTFRPEGTVVNVDLQPGE